MPNLNHSIKCNVYKLMKRQGTRDVQLHVLTDLSAIKHETLLLRSEGRKYPLVKEEEGNLKETVT